MSATERPRERVCIESIRIGRAPGIDGAFALTELGPGVTVIHGPNGSGKSTTARSLHALLWPEPANDGCLIEATLSYAGYRWTIRRDGSAVRCQRDGIDHTPLTFAHLTPETRDRYHLALHDLLAAEDRTFAAYVTREASGGFDLEAAAGTVGFSSAPPAPTNLARTLKDATAAYQEVVRKQRDLEQQETELAVLEVESERARQAGLNILKLSAIGDALAARAELEDAIETCHRFDTGLAHVTVGHADRLKEWRTEEPLLRRKLADLERVIAGERERVARTGLPSERVTARAIRILEAQYNELCQAEEARRAADTRLAAARLEVSALQTRIAPHLPPSLQQEQAVALLRAYDEALNRQEDAARISEAEALLAAWIPRPAGAPDPERLQHGWRALAAWMQTPPPPIASPALGTARLLALAAALLAIAEGVLLGVIWHPAGFGLAVAGLVIGLVVLVAGREPAPIDERNRFADDYRRLALPDPPDWTDEAVAELLGQTLRAFLQELSRERDAERWRSLAPHLERRDRSMAEAREQAAALAADLGAEVRLDRPALATLTGALESWLKVSHDVAQLERNRELLLEAEQDGLAAFNQTAAGLGGELAASGQEARSVLGHLQDRYDELKQATRAIEAAVTERDTVVLPACDRIERNRAALIERYGGERSLEEIELLTGQYEPYRQALQRVRTCRDQLASRTHRLPHDIRLDDWTPERVQREIADERAVGERAAGVDQRIGAIQQSIQAAKSRDDVAAALAAVEQARDALRERRDDHLVKTAGRLLLDAVRRETREANLPAVAHRARELFAEITHGRYRLNFNPGPPASFTATDTTTGSEHTLDELSSGTRVQLLIAVRTAFVDLNEQDAILPMIFDETLANADAARADALIETTFRLTADGRQVLYFTAQLDEVEKWRQLAARHRTVIRVIDLAEARRLAATTRPAPVDLPPVEHTGVPAPNGSTRAEYRRLLGAPPLNLWSADGGDFHLWHLLDDLDQLHRLAGRQITRWGQLRQLTIDDAVPALGIDRELLRRMTARADTCLALVEATRIGRGRPVTSLELRNSGGMSGRYTHDCLRLLDACEGDGRRFIECLKNKAITGFQLRNIERFTEYFEANGHIAADAALSPEEIRLQVVRRMSDAIEEGLLDLNLIDRLMAEAFTAAEAAIDPVDVSAPVLSGTD